MSTCPTKRNNFVAILVALVAGFVLGQHVEHSSAAALRDCSFAEREMEQATRVVHLQELELQKLLDKEHIDDLAALESKLEQQSRLERTCRATLTKMFTAASGIISQERAHEHEIDPHADGTPMLKVLAGSTGSSG